MFAQPGLNLVPSWSNPSGVKWDRGRRAGSFILRGEIGGLIKIGSAHNKTLSMLCVNKMASWAPYDIPLPTPPTVLAGGDFICEPTACSLPSDNIWNDRQLHIHPSPKFVGELCLDDPMRYEMHGTNADFIAFFGLATWSMASVVILWKVETKRNASTLLYEIVLFGQ